MTRAELEIIRWMHVYLANPTLRAQVTFDVFIRRPAEIFEEVIFGRAEFRPLLPAQRTAAWRIEAEIDAQIAQLERMLARRRMRVSDGKGVEPLHHHAWPRRAGARVARSFEAA